MAPYDYTLENRQFKQLRYKRALLGPSKAESRRQDAFYQLGIDPLYEAQNSSLLSHFVTEMGRIQTRAETGLTWKTQRRLGKAIRRAKKMGIMPVFSRRPLRVKQSDGFETM